MPSTLEDARGTIEGATLRILRTNVADNHSALAPFRLPALAAEITGALLDFLAGVTTSAIDFGERLGEAGLGPASIVALTRSLMRTLHADLDVDGQLRLHEFLTDALAGHSRHARARVLRQRDETQAALERAVYAREEELRQVIVSLSTPVMPIYQRILVLPLIGAIEDERATKITERLLHEVQVRQAQIVLIDVTGVPAAGVAVAAALLRTTRTVRLLGARAVLVGIRPDMARVLVDLGIDLSGSPTLATLQTGIEWALRELGLAILPRPATERRSPASASATSPAAPPRRP